MMNQRGESLRGLYTMRPLGHRETNESRASHKVNAFSTQASPSCTTRGVRHRPERVCHDLLQHPIFPEIIWRLNPVLETVKVDICNVISKFLANGT